MGMDVVGLRRDPEHHGRRRCGMGRTLVAVCGESSLGSPNQPPCDMEESCVILKADVRNLRRYL